MLTIAVDFDGTCVRHDFPKIGPEVPGAVATLRALLARGDRLILWTVRSGEHLDAAVAWFRERNLTLWGVNENPEQAAWSQSRKVYAEAYVDDAAIGAPSLAGTVRPVIDWARVWCAFGFDPREYPERDVPIPEAMLWGEQARGQVSQADGGA